jgi:hypothetical protein
MSKDLLDDPIITDALANIGISASDIRMMKDVARHAADEGAKRFLDVLDAAALGGELALPTSFMATLALHARANVLIDSCRKMMVETIAAGLAKKGG